MSKLSKNEQALFEATGLKILKTKGLKMLRFVRQCPTCEKFFKTDDGKKYYCNAKCRNNSGVRQERSRRSYYDDREARKLYGRLYYEKKRKLVLFAEAILKQTGESL